MKIDSHSAHAWASNSATGAPAAPTPSSPHTIPRPPGSASGGPAGSPAGVQSRTKRSAEATQSQANAPANSAGTTGTELSSYLKSLGDLSHLQPPDPYGYAYEVLKTELPKRWGITVDPDRIVFVRDETRITNATYENLDGTGTHRALYPGPTLTQAMIENRQELRDYTLLGHGPEKITHSFREVRPDGRISDHPLPLSIKEFKDFVWNTNFAQSYANRVREGFDRHRPVMQVVTRGSMLHEAQRLGETNPDVSPSLAREGRDIVLAAAGYDPRTTDLSTLTKAQLSQPRAPLPGISVRPLTIAGKESTDILVMHRDGSQASVLYAAGHGLRVFPNQAALVQFVARNAGQPAARDELASHFRIDDRLGTDGTEAVDDALAKLGRNGRDVPSGRFKPNAQEWEITYRTVGLGAPITGDVGQAVVDRLENRLLDDGHALITSDADYTRRKATEVWNKVRERSLPIALMAASLLPGGQVLGPLLGIAAGATTTAIGMANELAGKTRQEREEGARTATEGGADLAMNAQAPLRNAASKPGVLLKSSKPSADMDSPVFKVGKHGPDDAMDSPVFKVGRRWPETDTQPAGAAPVERPGSHPDLDAQIQHAARNGRVRPEKLTTDGNHVTGIQVGGDAIFDAQANLVRNAEHEVLIQTFAWDPTSPGAQSVLDALLERASKPGPKLTVRLLINEGTGLAKKFMQMTSNNKGAGGRWPSDPDALIGNYKHDPNFKYRPLLDKMDFEVRVHQHQGANAMHGKMVIVDDRYAATTGANVQARNHGDNPAYDMGVTLEGPAASGMRDAFVYNWNKSVNPDQKTHALSQDYAFPPSAAPAIAGAGTRISVVTRAPNANPLSRTVDNPQNQAFLSTIDGAQRDIAVMTPNLNADHVIDALARAADRNVKVRIIVSKEFNDARVAKPFGGGTNADAIARLKAKTRHPENLDIRYFQNPNAPEGAPVPSGNAAGNGASHAKLLIADRDVAIVGSANMDNSSWYYAGELNLVVQSPSTATDLNAKVFEPAWTRSPVAT